MVKEFKLVKELRFYDLLDVPPHVDFATIKKAYHELALKFHPDRKPESKDHQDCFSAISKAYAVLSDPIKREFYDRYGEAELKKFCDDELAKELARQKAKEAERRQKRWERRMRTEEERKFREQIEKHVKQRKLLFEKGYQLCKNGDKMITGGLVLVSIGTVLGCITAAASITLLPVAACAYALPGVVSAYCGANDKRGGQKLMAKNGSELKEAKPRV